MNIEKELRDALLAMSEVTDIVGTRIWSEWFRTETIPAIVFEFDSEDQETDLAGKGGKTVGVVNLICRADTRKASRDLSEAVRLNGTDPGTGLAGYAGTEVMRVVTRGSGSVEERDGDTITLRAVSTTFKATLLGQIPSITPKAEGSNAHWYDTNMSFELQWYEGR